MTINNASIRGQVFSVESADFVAANNSFAVEVTSWGAGNTLIVNTSTGGDGTAAVKIAAGWTGTIIRNGVALTPGTEYPV